MNYVGKTGDLRIKHGLSKSMIYKKYKRAEERCKPNYKNHERYYDRGVRFLRTSFKEFYNDMNESYEQHCKEFGPENTTLDRIDNDGPYCKENCRWATMKEQSRNRRPCKKITFNGIKYSTIIEFCEATGKKPSTISTRINRDGMSLEDAITTVPNSLPRKGRQVEYKGKVYPSISALCREVGINKNTVFVRMVREGMSLEDAIETPINGKMQKMSQKALDKKQQTMPKKILMICGETCVKCKFLKPHLENWAQKNGILFEEKDVNEATPEEIEGATQLPVIYFGEDRVEYDDALTKIM